VSAHLPPIGGHAPALQCNRLTGGTFDQPDYCGRPGTWHIIWTADAENGIACDEHADEARRLWVYFGLHAYDPVCSMPGATYLPDEDRCVIDEDSLGLTAAAAVEVGA
jgi:hypothetical protein